MTDPLPETWDRERLRRLRVAYSMSAARVGRREHRPLTADPAELTEEAMEALFVAQLIYDPQFWDATPSPIIFNL